MGVARILIHACAPWNNTGYGQQTAQLALRLKAAGHDVEISAHFGLEGASLHWNGIRVHPGANDFGDRLLPGYMDDLKPDLTLTLMDVWTLKGKPLSGRPLASWVPVDHEPLGEPIIEFFRESGSRPVAMSRHGHKQLDDAGFAPLYAPHAIDTTVFRPTDRTEARDTWGIPESAFAIVMVATNADNGPSRKGWVEALRAFKAFHERHEDALLVLHTDLTGQHNGGGAGINIGWLCDRIGVEPEWLHVTPPRLYDKGIPPQALASLYGASDVLLAPSYGEGFGIPAIEAQACGTPVIVSDFSAQTELCGSGWLIPGEPEWIDHYRAWWQRPSVPAIIQALEESYADAHSMRDAAVEFAGQYDADRVFNEHWTPTLEQLLVKPNRQARRRAQREKVAA